ncbi:MAG: hypothetical protein NTV68_01495 [Methanomicrobiales archaeon]|nr:hypothetical protein [Methanomicrobiales archaeon]
MAGTIRPLIHSDNYSVSVILPDMLIDRRLKVVRTPSSQSSNNLPSRQSGLGRGAELLPCPTGIRYRAMPSGFNK